MPTWMRAAIVGLAVASTLARAGAGGGSTAPPPDGSRSGIEGDALIGPLRPSHRIDRPAPGAAPFSTTLVILEGIGEREIARVATESDGHFRVELPPGEYVVRQAPGAAVRAPRAEPVSVTVLAGAFTSVTIHFDNGMR